jgi:hypothetical protein
MPTLGGGGIDTQRSTNEIIFFLGGNPISWQSSKQKVVALSSCEAEYQGIWLARLLIDMLRVESGMPELFMDNHSAIALCKNLVFQQVRFYFIRDCIEEERIQRSSWRTC